MKNILLAHACRYPAMEPTDAVKLLYQSEFGGGHLIRNEAACLERLREEYEHTPQYRDIPLLESIGSGIYRVHLSALDAHGYTAAQLGEDFIRSASRPRGSLKGFREKLSLLENMTRYGLMPFSHEALIRYLKDYEAAGFPPVSHSEAYRCAYCPAYRVIHEDHLSQNIKNCRML